MCGYDLLMTQKPPSEGGFCLRVNNLDCRLEPDGLCFVPFFFFFFDRHVKLDGIETDYFQLRAAIIALDNVAFVGIFVHLNLGVTFGAGSSWHRLLSSVISA